jgi:hypothetical protein
MSDQTQVGILVFVLCLGFAVVVRCVVGIIKILLFDQPREPSIRQQETTVGRHMARRRARQRRR